MSESSTRVYRFGGFQLDTGKRLLFAGEEIVGLTPKAFDTLLVLVESRGDVLSKEELMRRVWPDQFVEENNLAQNIHTIRKLLGEDIKYVETIPKRGYRFVAEVDVLDVSGQARASTVSLSQAVGASSSSQGTSARSLVESATSTVITPKTHYALSTGDVNIAYQVVGDGPIDLVFVMGWVSHLEYFWREPSFARFLTRLASFSRLILFDKRGTGLSDRVQLSELPTLEQRMTDVQAVMDAVGSQRAALLGLSEGGPMCSLFAATYPTRTTALVMLGTYAKRIRSDNYPWAPTEEQQQEFLEEIRQNWGEPVGIDVRAPSVARQQSFRDWWAEYLRMGASPTAALTLTKMNAAIDVRGVLPSVRVPTLIIHRTDDGLLPVGGGRYVASLIPGAKFVELPGRDHLPFVGDQDAIVDEIEEFLTGARTLAEVDRVLTTVLFMIFDDVGEEDLVDLIQSYARRQLALFRGKEIEMSRDHLFATFDGPARAIRCARSIADDAARLGVEVRGGLHTGECDVVGEKISGTTVQLAQAVAEYAAPKSILVSHTVNDLVAGSGIVLTSRELRTFEDLPGKWRLFGVEET